LSPERTESSITLEAEFAIEQRSDEKPAEKGEAHGANLASSK
jgi:hypothetical protein